MEAGTVASIPLSALLPGEAGTIVRVGLVGPERRALLDLGFVPGTVVERIFQSPLGDPTAFRLRSTVVALRRSQAEAIEVQRCKS
ncbi:MAG: ferrous iron transport protein A [Chthonomonadaceae bacterium]|nr:ferrous iron transport protein A [Chthonomonadaceae bacterium]